MATSDTNAIYTRIHSYWKTHLFISQSKHHLSMLTDLRPIMVTLILLLCFNTFNARTIHVPDDANSIQSALDSALPCDTILVAPGTYREHLVINTAQLTLIGKQGTSAPASVSSNVIIDGQHSGITVSILADGVSLSGFEIINGKDSGSSSRGGNIFCSGNSVTISYNRIADGATTLQGEGGSIGHGAGVSITGNDVTLIGNKIVNNEAWGAGGGIDCFASENTWIINNWIQNNQADFAGGINIESCNRVYLINNVIKGNYAAFRHGGGLFLKGQTTNAKVYNNTFFDNKAKEWGAGGAIGINVNEDVDIDLFNNIIAFNENPKENASDQTLAGGIYCLSEVDGLSLRNNCFFGNENGDLLGCEAGLNAIFEDPQLSSNGKLQIGSPCIDQGLSLSSFVRPPYDAELNLRLQGVSIDIGAYEFGQIPYSPPSIISHPENQTACSGQTATFSIAALSGSGGEAVTYSWLKDGCPVGNTSNNRLSFENVDETDAGYYSCVVSNGFGYTIQSEAAELVVGEGGTVGITIESDAGPAICEGQLVTFTAFLEGAGENPILHWFVNNQMNAQSTTTFQTTELTAGDVVTCQMTSMDECTLGTVVTSNAIAITIDNDISVSILVSPTPPIPGALLTFSATAVNANAPAYTWKVNDDIVSGAHDRLFTTDQLSVGDRVRCIITSGDCGQEAISNEILVGCAGEAIEQGYRHPFQTYDDDVDIIRTFSNSWGGNSGRIDGNAANPQFTTVTNTTFTRSGKGRSLEINYGPLAGWSQYAESFERKWFDTSTTLYLNNIFPDFKGSDFANRKIDGIAFYYRLDAQDTLTIQLELEDAQKGKARLAIDLIPGSGWQKITVPLCQFKPDAIKPFNASIAKFMGFTFADFVDGEPLNVNETGTLFLDDIFLIESEYSKPTFSNHNELLQYLNKVSFRHFWMAVDPTSFFALDRHIWDDLISVDAIGFELSAYVIAHKNDWIEGDKIKNRVRTILRSLVEDCHHASTKEEALQNPLKYATVEGIWAHFLEPGSLERKDANTEYSLFSNALLLSGVIVAMQYFDNDSEINYYGNQLLELSNWQFLYRQQDGLMYYDWKPEVGYSAAYTDWWTEELDLAFLLGVGTSSAQRRLPANPYFAPSYRRPGEPECNYVFSAPGANFTYSFLQMYARFNSNTDRFQNAQKALLNDYNYPQNSLGNFNWLYDPRIFGITACEGPDALYHAYGYCCKLDTHNDPDGTIAVYGAGSSILFIPEQAIAALSFYYQELDDDFWNRCGYGFWSPVFGFPDAFHLDPDNAHDSRINGFGFNGPWLSVPRFGIDVGPMLMNIDSYLSEQSNQTSIRDLFSSFDPLTSLLPQFATIERNNIPERAVISQVNDSNCNSSEVLLRADVENAGLIGFEFQWKIDGQPIGGNTNELQLSTFVPGQVVTCDISIEFEKCQYQYVSTSEPFTLQKGQNLVVSSANNSPLCLGEFVQLTADGGTSFEWTGPNGFSSSLPSPLTEVPGIYYVEVSNDEGCTGMDSTTVLPFHILPTIELADSLKINSGEAIPLDTIGSTGYSWVWTGPNGFMTTIPNPVVETEGIYYLTVKSENGCEVSDTVIIDIIVSSTSPTSINIAMEAYPNPTNSDIWISVQGVPTMEGLLSVYNGQGQRLLQDEVHGPNIERSINLSTFPKGVYWVSIKGYGWTASTSVIKI